MDKKAKNNAEQRTVLIIGYNTDELHEKYKNLKDDNSVALDIIWNIVVAPNFFMSNTYKSASHIVFDIPRKGQDKYKNTIMGICEKAWKDKKWVYTVCNYNCLSISGIKTNTGITLNLYTDKGNRVPELVTRVYKKEEAIKEQKPDIPEKIVDIENPQPIVTIIGSNRKYEQDKRELELSLSACGFVIYNIGSVANATLLCNRNERVSVDANTVNNMTNNFYRMMLISDYVVVYNKDSYIEDNTKDEMFYALKQGKNVYALKPMPYDDLINQKVFIRFQSRWKTEEFEQYEAYKITLNEIQVVKVVV